jgi:class 3 adenylate cyclase
VFGDERLVAVAVPPTRLPSGSVTFLLTDVVGSTRIWEDAPEVMPGALERHDRLLQAAVETNAGVFLKTKGEGDSTFSVFGRAADAVSAARDAQTALQHEPWPTATPIRVRMAVHTGQAVERDGDYFGPTVNRAARLRAIADPDQVLISRATAEVVADLLPARCELQGMGVQHLRDLARPELVYCLVAEEWAQNVVPLAVAEQPGAAAGSLPLPPRLASAVRVEFTGRLQERQRLAGQFHTVSAGARGVALVTGEPGIGKTRLATAAAIAARAEGAAVLLGRCDEDVSIPYQPWIEALGHLVTHAPASVLNKVGPRKLADLAGLVPEVLNRHPVLPSGVQTDPETDRYLLFSSVVALVEATGAVAPVVLLLDDLQWADKPSLLLLRHILQSAAPLRLQVIVTFRDSEVTGASDLAELLAALHRESIAESIPLSGLDESDIVEMIEAAAGQPLDRDGMALARALRRDTDGNPFYLGEMLRHLAESGQTAARDDRGIAAVDVDSFGLPQSVRAVIGQRVARLGTTAQQMLRLAAVIGREFDFELLGAVSGRTDEDVVDVLEVAQRGSVVNEVSGRAGRYSFAHALVQRTLYEELGSSRRQLAHRQVATTLGALRDDGANVQIAELARHWMSGGRTADAAKIVGYARAAGDAAVAALAPDEAARWYSDALAVHDNRPDGDQRTRVELLIALGTTQLQDGELRLLEAARIAQAEGDDNGLIDAMLADTRGWRSRVREVDTERLTMVEAALVAVGPADSVRRARLLKMYATDLAYTGESKRCWQLHDEAVEMARRIGDPDTLLHVLIRKLAGFWTPDTLEYRLAASREAVELADRIGDPAVSFWAYTDLSLAAGEAASEELAPSVARRDAYAEELGAQPGLDYVISSLAGTRELMAGHLDDAERIARETFDKAVTAGSRHAEPLLAVQLSAIRLQQGDETDILELHQEVVAKAPHLDSNRALLVRAHISAGNLATASELMDAEYANGIPVPWDVYWLLAHCYWSDVAVRLGHRPAARVLYDRLMPWERHVAVVSSTVDSATALYLGMLASLLDAPEAADGHFAIALELHQAMSAPFPTARSELEWGKLLLRDGPTADPERARDLLESAHSAALLHGYAEIARQAANLLGRAPS